MSLKKVIEWLGYAIMSNIYIRISGLVVLTKKREKLLYCTTLLIALYTLLYGCK